MSCENVELVSLPEEFDRESRQTSCCFYCVVCASGVFALIISRYLNCLLPLINKALTPKSSAYYRFAPSWRLYQKVEIFAILGPRSQSRAPIGVKFCVAKRNHVPLGFVKFHVNRWNESPLAGENVDFRPPKNTETSNRNFKITFFTAWRKY